MGNETGCDRIIEQLVNETAPEVDEQNKRDLMIVLAKYRDVFAKGEDDLGRTDVVRHRIEKTEALPVRQALRRHPPMHLDAIQKHVSDMLKQDVVRASNSPWASNIVLVKKKDGSLRCCIDYRPLNLSLIHISEPTRR